MHRARFSSSPCTKVRATVFCIVMHISQLRWGAVRDVCRVVCYQRSSSRSRGAFQKAFHGCQLGSVNLDGEPLESYFRHQDGWKVIFSRDSRRAFASIISAMRERRKKIRKRAKTKKSAKYFRLLLMRAEESDEEKFSEEKLLEKCFWKPQRRRNFLLGSWLDVKKKPQQIASFFMEISSPKSFRHFASPKPSYDRALTFR